MARKRLHDIFFFFFTEDVNSFPPKHMTSHCYSKTLIAPNELLKGLFEVLIKDGVNERVNE